MKPVVVADPHKRAPPGRPVLKRAQLSRPEGARLLDEGVLARKHCGQRDWSKRGIQGRYYDSVDGLILYRLAVICAAPASGDGLCEVGGPRPVQIANDAYAHTPHIAQGGRPFLTNEPAANYCESDWSVGGL